MMSTFRRASCFASATFSRLPSRVPAACSPSRSVVSNTATLLDSMFADVFAMVAPLTFKSQGTGVGAFLILLVVLEKMGYLLAGVFGVVNRNLRGFFSCLAHVFSRVYHGPIRQSKCVFRAVSRFHNQLLGPSVQHRDRPIHSLHPVLAHPVHFKGCLLGSFYCVVGHHFASFFHPVKRVFCSRVRSMHGSLGN